MAGRIVGGVSPYRGDLTHGGAYRIAAVVDERGVVGQYRVHLHERGSGRLLRVTLSDPVSGAYLFDRIAFQAQGYYAVAFDHGASPVNAAIADLITPVRRPT